MPAAESTKEGSRTVSLRLSMMTPDGLAVDYDESGKNDQASYDAACLKLSDRKRTKVASGWDVLGRFIIETEDVGADIRTRMLRGKTWEFVGEPAEPAETPPHREGEIERTKERGRKKQWERSNCSRNGGGRFYCTPLHSSRRRVGRRGVSAGVGRVVHEASLGAGGGRPARRPVHDEGVPQVAGRGGIT